MTGGLAGSVLTCSQIPFHPYNYAQHKPLLEYAAEHDILIEAYSSLRFAPSSVEFLESACIRY